MNVATPGKDAPNLDKTAPKRALFSSPSAVAHNKTNISTPTTTDKRDTRESKKNLMDNRHMKLADNEQMGDVRKQLRFNEEVHASANARKDMLQRRMIEMKRMEMEVRRQMAELAEKHMRQMEEMKMRTTQMTQKAEWMKEIIAHRAAADDPRAAADDPRAAADDPRAGGQCERSCLQEAAAEVQGRAGEGARTTASLREGRDGDALERPFLRAERLLGCALAD